MSDTFSALRTELASTEAAYQDAKKAAKLAKDKADQAVAKRYWDETQEPNLEELAEIFGKAVATVTAIAKEAGIELATGKRGRPSAFTEDQQKEIAEKFANEKDNFKRLSLAVEHRVAPETIKGWAVKFGFLTVNKREKANA